jgi:hypothetical protein
MTKPYHEMNWQERLAARVAQNRAIEARVAERKAAKQAAVDNRSRRAASRFLRVVSKPQPSCWGCGHDYLSRWTPVDLMPAKVDGSPARICPDCHEEAVALGNDVTY